MKMLVKYAEQSLKAHLAIIVLILFIVYLLFLSNGTISPLGIDGISVLIYLSSFLIALYFFIVNLGKNFAWKFLLMLLLISFAFLEESEFLSELRNLGIIFHVPLQIDFAKDYFEDLGFKNRHAHSFHNAFVILLKPWFQAHVNFSLFSQTIDHLKWILGLAVLFVSTGRIKQSLNFGRVKTTTFSLFFILNGFVASYHLLRLPIDPSNLWLFNLSAVRLGLILAILLISFFPAIFHSIRSKELFSGHTAFRKNIMIFILLALIFALLRGQFSLITTLNPFSLKIAQRLTPIVFYILGASILLILDLLAKKGIFSLKLSEYWHQIVRAQINFPSLIYVLGFLLFAFVLAQLIDAKFLLTTYTERETIEEILEITGGILLVIAALLIPYNKKA